MTKRRSVSLVSGLWAGHYEQSRRHYPQRMVLEFADGLIRGNGIDDIGAFAIEGDYRLGEGEVRLGWIKTYEGGHSVLYLGVLDGGEIRGRWRLSGATGSFAIEPTSPDKKRP